VGRTCGEDEGGRVYRKAAKGAEGRKVFNRKVGKLRLVTSLASLLNAFTDMNYEKP
jgi:hypothetical protein